MKKPLKIIIILLIIIIAAIIILGLWLSHVPSSTYEVEEIDSEAHWGKISGSLGYPSDYIPEMGVCAENTDGQDMYCTYEVLEDDDYTYGYGYEVSVPPGDYNVFAHLVDPETSIGYTDEDRAYHSRFVKCGMGAECSDHKPIKVEVERYQHVTGINPIDWYN